MFEKNEIKTLTTQIKSNLKNKYLLTDILRNKPHMWHTH